MKLSFIYSIESELNYLSDISSRAERLQKMGYKVQIPKGLDLEKLGKLNQYELKSIIEKELDQKLAHKLSQKLREEIESKEKEVSDYLKSLPGKTPPELTITWTKYGPGGSYGNAGEVRLRFDATVSLYMNFIDEITHSIIEKPIIRHFSLNHAEKESIADYLTRMLFPERKYQRFGPPSEDLLKRVGLLE